MSGEQLSHVVGATEPAILDLTISGALEQAVRRWPDGEAVVSSHQAVRLTWAELLAAADAFATGLLELGLQRGDRVGVWAPNCAEWTIAQFATARSGMILVSINPAYRQAELQYTLGKVGAKALICANTFKTSNYPEIVESVVPEIALKTDVIRSEALPELRHVITIGGGSRPGWIAFDAVSRLGTEASVRSLDLITANLEPNDPINIQFTSGTTGFPKGATLSNRNLINNAYFVGLGMGLVAGDRLCVPVPLYHCFGMVMSNLACLLHGATMVYPSAGFDPLAVLQTIERERCTALHGVPTMFIAELEHPEFDNFDLSSLRTGLMAGSPCPVEIMRKVMTSMHLRDVGIAYGMTETSPVSFQTALDDSLDRRVSTIGRVQPHLEVKIIDPETGAIVPRGQPGELCTRGYSVMLGYWEDPGKTAEVLRDGWMHTGDLAVLDQAGYGRIVGRIKDMIIRGGENIYPREIEEFIYAHPAVEDVQVVGIPDEKYGEEVVACIKLRAGQAVGAGDIIEFCRGRIAHYKVPRHVRFMDSFPMTVTGKIQKHVLRKIIVDDLSGGKDNAANA